MTLVYLALAYAVGLYLGRLAWSYGLVVWARRLRRSPPFMDYAAGPAALDRTGEGARRG